MKLKHLIDDSNRQLYQTIQNIYPIQLKKSSSTNWGSNLANGIVTISHCPSNHPNAAFVHELLHIDTQIKGYRRIRTGLSLDMPTHLKLIRLCDAIDNEFQHHKMYSQFVSLGYSPAEFYSDDDSNVIKYLENVLNTSNLTLLSMVVDYLTLIAPGGTIDQLFKTHLMETFRSYNAGAFESNFDTIDGIIARWVADQSYDAKKYISEFLLSIGCGQLWLGYTSEADGFPLDGYFVGESFSYDDIVNAFSNHK